MAIGFASYEIPRTGLYVNERGLNVTGHNISNINTPGYVRQQAMIMDNSYQNINSSQGLNQLGMGADIQEIRQIRNIFLDNIYRQENTTLGYWETRRKTFEDIESIVAEPMRAGLQTSLNSFWDSWQELSKEPDSLTVRALVRQRGESLVQHMNHLGAQLDSLQNDLNAELTVRIGEVNSITSSIAELNLQILKNEVNKSNANDYRDQRNLLADRLSKLIDVDITEMQDGQYYITLGGHSLVQKDVSTNLYAGHESAGDIYYVPKLEGTDITVPIKNGILKGILESRGEIGGQVGSFGNGTPNTMTDVVIMIDESSGIAFDATALADYKAKIEESLNLSGLNHNVIIETFTPTGTEISSTDVEGVVSSITGFRDGAHRQVLLFSDKDIDGAMSGFLENNGITLSNANSTDDTQLTSMAEEINESVNREISLIPKSSNIISDIRTRLNAMINILAREINSIHSSGTTLGGTEGDGEAFFTLIHGDRPFEMGNIQVNRIFSDLNKITAAKSEDSGDNTNASQIASLRGIPLIRDLEGLLSPDEYYQSIILAIGNGGAEAVIITDSQHKLVESADLSRISISGVSMDEEMANMMRYKFAYDASARALNVIDSMMDQVINRME